MASQAPAGLARANAAELQAFLQSEELERLRNAAVGWRNGLAAVFGLVATVGLARGRSEISSLPRWDQWLVGGLLLASLAAAAGGSFLAMRAAFGLPREMNIDEMPPASASREDTAAARIRAWRRLESRRTARALHAAIYLAFVTGTLLAGALAALWFGR